MNEILDEKTYEDRSIKFATFWQRFIAFVLDIALLFLISRFILVIFGVDIFPLWYVVIPVLLVYFVFFGASEMQATIGMSLMNIRYVNERKRNISEKESLYHFLLSLILFPSLLTLLSTLQPSFYDKLAKVMVIKIK